MNLLFKLKQRLFGKYYWVGPESEIGVCDNCAFEKNFTKVPIRRIDKHDNIYLCKQHYEELRNHWNSEIRMDLPPFLRKI